MIKIIRKEEKIKVITPYNDDFLKYAKLNGGKWDAADKTWDFSLNAEESVKQTLENIFGWVEGEEQKKLLVRIRAIEFEKDNQIIVGGTILAYRPGRDYKMIFNGDAAVHSGKGFPSWGGSRRNPGCCAYEDTLIQATITQHDYDTLPDEKKQFVEVIQKIRDDREKILSRLKAEKEELTARLANIENKINELENTPDNSDFQKMKEDLDFSEKNYFISDNSFER